ncbi:hypothetical protein ACE41A_20520 [Bacillus cytotoxicus]|uniref:hypothetical protein n=1 Tax=Bacillus cytotoxicus TaxID=580165 RepID=UPI0035CA37F4
MVLKLTEEAGETSQALKVNGSEYRKLEMNDVKEECIDVILVSLALFYKLIENENEWRKK